MCSVCLEGIAFYYYLKDEINNRSIDYKDMIISNLYAQETLLLKELLLYIQKDRDKNDIIMILPTYCVRVIEDIFLHKQVDYFLFDKEILSSYFSELQSRFESFQKKFSWLKFWKPLYEKKSFLDLKILENFFSSSEMQKHAENVLNYYLQRFTGKPEIEEPEDYGVVYEEGEEPEDVKRYIEYCRTLDDELTFLYPVFHCALIYLAEVKRDVNMLQKIAYSKHKYFCDFDGLDLWLYRKARFYLIDIKGIEAIPELLNNGCALKYIYFYCIKNGSIKEKIDQLIREKMSKDIVQEWRDLHWEN